MRRLIVLAITLMSSTAFGLGPIPGEERFEGLLEDDQSKSAGADVMFTTIGEDSFVTITPRLDLNFGIVGVGLQAPLNLRVIDKKPKNDNDYGGIIREEDWDDPTEFLRAVRYFRYSHKGDTLYVKIGELAAEIGHGTIMSRYVNNLDVNKFHLGLQLDINTNWGGIETVFSDIGNTFSGQDEGTKLVGGRVYFKPVALADPESVFNIFQLGFSYVTDSNAPFELEQTDVLDEDGNPVPDDVDPTLTLQQPLVEDGEFKVARDKGATVFGLDLGIELLRSAMLDLTPYADLNFISGAGWGSHIGILAMAKLPIGIDLNIPIRVEYRRFKEDYIPTYFSTFYELERFTYPLGTGNTPKNKFVRDLPGKKGINGYYGDLALDFAGVFQIGAIYEDYDTGDPNLAAFLSVPALETFQFKAYYTRTGITGTDDIFKLDDRSMVIAQARYEVITYVYLVGRFTRQWVLGENKVDHDDDDTTPKIVKKEYESEDSWNVGLEFSLDF